MLKLLRKTATCLLIAATALTPSLAQAADGYQYFRLYGKWGQGPGGPVVPPPQSTLSYQISGPGTAMVGQSWSATAVVGGAVGPLQFSVYSGALPSWMALNAATGALSGTPTATGSGSATLRVKDSTGAAGYASLSVTVQAAMAVTGSPAQVATVGTGYAAQFAATGGSAPYVFSSASSLPPGVTLSASGLLSGTPSLAGNYPNIVIHAADSAGHGADSAAFQIGVAAPLAASWTPAAGQVGVSYVANLPAASGGRAPYHYTLNGAVPAGLTFDGTTGVFAGTPTTEGAYSLGITAIDADGRFASTGTKTLTIAPGEIVTPPVELAVAGTPPTSAEFGIGYTATFTATGGSGAGYVFDMAAGSLPPGLTLSSSGIVSGAPTAIGTFSGLQVRVTDSASDTALSGAFSITVSPQQPLVIAGNPSSSAQIGSYYQADFTAFNGTGTGYDFTSVGAALPPGLTLANVGGTGASISGTPSYVGTYSGLKIRVTDSGGHTADSSAFSITVAPPAGPALVVSGTPATFATVGTPYSAQLSATGGSGTGYAFALASGSVLPVGLTLDPSGSISGTPSTQQSSTFTVQATDSIGDTAQATYTVTVSTSLAFAGAPTSTNQGATYSFALTSLTGGGRAPYSYSLVSGALPTGMALDGTSVSSPGVSGSTSTAVLRATDADGRTANASLTFVVDPAVANAAPGALVTVAGTGTVRAGNTFGGSLSTNIANPSWNFAQSPSSPAINFAVAVDGHSFTAVAPGVSGPTDVTVTATAANGAASQASAPFTIRLLPQLVVAVTGSGSLNGVIGSPFAYGPFAYSGVVGTPNLQPHALQYSDGTMGGPVDVPATCPGLSVDVLTGTISGVPTASCTLEVRMMLTDSYDGSWVVHGSDGSWPNHLDGSGSVYQWIADPAPTITIVGAAATAARTSPQYVRSGAAIAGTLSTNVPAPTWSFSSAPSGLSLTASGSTFSGTAPSVASRTDYTVTATATSGAATASGQFPLSVAPALAVAMDSISGPIGSAVSVAPSVSGLGGSATYALIKDGNPYVSLATACPGLTFAAASGTISGTPTANCTVSNLSLRVADDFDGATASASFGISISGNTATATLSGANEVRQGAAISGTLSTDVPGATWSFSSSPSGLVLTASGSTFSGTAPSVSSQTVYSVTATATGGSYSASAAPVVITVDPTLAVSGGPSGTVVGSVGNALAATSAPTVSGLAGTASYALLQNGSAYSGLNAACGLSFSASTGQISGTPTQACSVTGLAIRVTDSRDGAAATTSPTFAVSVSGATASAALATASEVRAGAAIAGTLSTNLDAAVWSFSQTPSSPSFGLSGSGSAFAGTAPSVSSRTSYSVTATATSGGVHADAAPFAVTVDPAFAIAGGPSGTVSGVVGNPLTATATPSATGLVGTATYALLQNGSAYSGLNAACGLSFSASTGQISGTPSQACSVANLTIQATDSFDGSVGATSAAFAVSIGAATASATLSTATEVRAGAAVSGTMSTNLSGATWAFASAPSGLTLSASGATFSGTAPGVSSQTVYTVTATATAGSYSATAPTFTVTVDPTFTASGGAFSGSLNFVVGNPASTATLVASGVVGSLSSEIYNQWTGPVGQTGTPSGSPIDLAALCPGLSLDKPTGAIVGTPTATCSLDNLRMVAYDTRDGASVAFGSTTTSFSIRVGGATATATRTSPAEVRTGDAISGTLSTNLSGATWSFASAPAGLSLTASGASFSGTAPSVASQTSYGVVATATNAGTHVDATAFAVTVNPTLAISGGPSGTVAGTTGTVMTPTSAPGVSGLVGSATYALLQGGSTYTGLTAACGLSFSTSSGTISGTPSQTCSVSNLTIQVTDSRDGKTAATSPAFSVSVTPGVTVSGTPAAGVVSQAYSFTPTVSGGSGSYTSYALVNTSGTLSSLGLAFSTSTGAITGTPTASGAWQGTITAYDSLGNVGSSSTLTITVNPALTIAPSATSFNIAVGEGWGSGVTVTASGGSGGAKAFSVTNTTGTLGALGLSFNTSNGSIVNSPTAAGTWSGTIKVTDSSNPTGVSTPTITITVNAALAVSASANSATLVVNRAWSGLTMNRTGGVAPFTFSAVDTTGTLGALGLSLDPSTGTISGTPTTAGSWTGAVKVVDPGKPSGAQTASITITVNPALAIASSWPGSCTSGTQCQATFTASGGLASFYAWTVPSTEGGYATTAVNCTAGSATCTVRWTPTAAGTMTTTAVSVSDGGASVSSTTPSISVGASASSSQTFSFTGANQTFTVPANVTSITVKAWGAGGGGNGGTGASNAYPGGGGGFAGGTIAVTPGQVLTIQVGGGGHGDCANCLSPGNVGGWPNGGTSTFATSITGGAGGGSSGVFSGTPGQGTALVLAGAGGGGGAANSALGLAGGAGGGTTGGKCADASCGGGGTQSAGGAAGTQGSGSAGAAGGAFQGASATNVAGAGGGGYWGGGTGGHPAAYQGGGGGGSSYTAGTVTSATNTGGSGPFAGNDSDTAYQAGIGVGGAVNGNGGNGLVVINWTNYTLRTPTAVNTTFTYSAGGGASQANLYDGSDATPAADPTGVQTTTQAAYDLGAAYAITRVRLITAAANGFSNADTFAVQYSDSGLTGGWTSASASVTASVGTGKLAVVDFASVGAHRYWRIVYASGATAGNGWLGELGFYTSP